MEVFLAAVAQFHTITYQDTTIRKKAITINFLAMITIQWSSLFPTSVSNIYLRSQNHFSPLKKYLIVNILVFLPTTAICERTSRDHQLGE